MGATSIEDATLFSTMAKATSIGNFEWWDLEKDRLSIRPQLPFVTERTDVLTCQSETA